MTLSELMVVVAISIILVILAVISTQTVVERTKVSRVREEHRVLIRALQNYSMDYSEFPSAKQGLDGLLKPTAYLGELPRDPFQSHEGVYLYLYPNTREMGCVLISPGPDGDFDLPTELWAFTSQKDIDHDVVPLAVAALRANSIRDNTQRPKAGRSPSSMTEAQLAVLTTYLRLAQYDAAKGGDGDIITVLK